MTIKGLDVLKSAIAAAIPDNIVREIDPVDVRDTGFMDSIDSLAPGNVTRFGAKGDGVTDDTTALQAALDAGLGVIYIPKGVFISNGLTLSANDTLVFGEGEIKTINNSSAIPNGLLNVTGDRNTIYGLTFRGNLLNPPTVGLVDPLVVDGNENLIDNCIVLEARGLVDTEDRRSNILVRGDRNIMRGVRSFDPGFALFETSGDHCQWLNCYGRKGAASQKGFNATALGQKNIESLLIDGLDIDDILQLDQGFENEDKRAEHVVVSNCHIIATSDNAAKFAHIRTLDLVNNHFENTGIGNGVAFGEDMYDVKIRGGLISGNGAGPFTRHIVTFNAGNKIRNMNSFICRDVRLGNYSEDDTLGVERAIEVTCFRGVVEHCIVRHVNSNAQFLLGPDLVGVTSQTVNDPSTLSPSSNETFIVGPTPIGLWAGEAFNIALWTGSVWTFEVPTSDTRLFVSADTDFFQFLNATVGWVVVPTEAYLTHVVGNDVSGFRDGENLQLIGFFNQIDSSGAWNVYDNLFVNRGTGGGAPGGVDIGANGLTRNMADMRGPKAWNRNGFPTSTGTWRVSDQVWHEFPAIGKPAGWICTAAGNPGTWAAMADLA